jgi:hypothetical protein
LSHANYVSVEKTIIVEVEVPSTCEDLRRFYDYMASVVPDPNPDIVGLGVCGTRATLTFPSSANKKKILLAFFITAGSVVVLALTAYVGGFLPAHLLRRVDTLIIRAHSRNETSKWRAILEGAMMSLSDQQLVTGLAILIAGYYEMVNNDLSILYWQIIVYLAWLSSSVHIASLALLRDVLNKNPRLRNVRVAGMMVLLILLLTAMWPTRFVDGLDIPAFPARCYWTSARNFPWDEPRSEPLQFSNEIDVNWVISMTMLVSAYGWKLSQLFASSRGLFRRWLVAKPEAAIERLMCRTTMSDWPQWATRLIGGILTICYVSFVAYAELAESFVASIIYLCLALPYGIATITSTLHKNTDGLEIAVESLDDTSLTFGQLVPLFMLVLPMLSMFQIFLGMWLALIRQPNAPTDNPSKSQARKRRDQVPSTH